LSTSQLASQRESINAAIKVAKAEILDKSNSKKNLSFISDQRKASFSKEKYSRNNTM
jgi:hypothetical protein